MKGKTILIVVLLIIVIIVAIVLYKKSKLSSESVEPGGTLTAPPAPGFFTADQMRFWLLEFHRSSGRSGDSNWAKFRTVEGEKTFNLDQITSTTASDIYFSNFQIVKGAKNGSGWVIEFFIPTVSGAYVTYTLLFDGRFTRKDKVTTGSR